MAEGAQAEPDRQVTISEQDAYALIAIVARVHGEMLVDNLSQGFPGFLQRRLHDAGLLDSPPAEAEVSTAFDGEISVALDGLVARLRRAVGDE
ncbi:hypothetical protein ABTZ78_12545 [Streptomyces bauhiniae]|uniref:hypothetical protein n=1 Tax=Streptomyces bauhiniae TaxID=2340725 RepID=UPI00331A6CC4